MTQLARLLSNIGDIPLLGDAVRRVAGAYIEGSTTTIRVGRLAGYKWRRHHRYVNGYWVGNYELPIQECLGRLLTPGATFYDVGGNAGFFALLGAELVGRSGRVFSFDPVPENGSSISEQVVLNELANVHHVNLAVGSAAGTSEFSFSLSNLAAGHLGKPGLDDRAITVGVTTLDAFTEGHPSPDVIKVDVEGAEVDVLEGAKSLLRDRGPVWLIEMHGHDKASACVERLKAAGYRFEDLTGAAAEDPARLPHVVARPRG